MNKFQTIARADSASWGQALHAGARRAAVAIAAAYVAGEALGHAVHGANDRLARLASGRQTTAQEPTAQEPAPAAPAAPAALLQLIAAHRAGTIAAAGVVAELHALTGRQLAELAGTRAKRSKAHYVRMILA